MVSKFKDPIQITIDQGVNLKVLKKLQSQGLVQLNQVHDIEQIFKKVKPQGKAFTLGNSTLGGPDMLAGDSLHKIEKIIGPTNKNDIQHLYSAYLNKSTYFITENPKDFIFQSKREELEEILEVKIRTTDEFIEEILSESV